MGVGKTELFRSVNIHSFDCHLFLTLFVAKAARSSGAHFVSINLDNNYFGEMVVKRFSELIEGKKNNTTFLRICGTQAFTESMSIALQIINHNLVECKKNNKKLSMNLAKQDMNFQVSSNITPILSEISKNLNGFLFYEHF